MKNSFFFYKDRQNNIYNENGQLTYDPMEDVMSIIDDPNIVFETLVNHSLGIYWGHHLLPEHHNNGGYGATAFFFFLHNQDMCTKIR